MGRSIDIREINKDNVSESKFLLSWEQWEDIFAHDNVNNMFYNVIFLHPVARSITQSFSSVFVRRLIV
jgi:hypothetical protein